MSEVPPGEKAPPALALAQQVDQVCDRFEAACLAGQRPRIEDYLADRPGAEREALLPELILLDVHYRRLGGEAPQPADYHDRFPELGPEWLARALAAPTPPTLASRGPPRPRLTDSFPGPLLRAAAEASPTDLLTPFPEIPGYRVLGVLGRGGMGVVYKAWQERLQRAVALKMILAGGHAGAADLARFRREAEAIARLQHPHIVQIYDIAEHDGRPFFALELCAGGSLENKLRGTPLPADEAARLVETLARAMHAVHQQHIIHRDLKPANVLLSPGVGESESLGVQAERRSADSQTPRLPDSWTPKITDFGLAKRLDAAGQTASGAIVGTPSYMAPEQAGGRTKEVGPATDVYALGAILYECLTGRPPFKAPTPMDTLWQVLHEEPVPPTQLQSKTPPDLETICLKCLQKEAPKRYASAEELAEDLRRFQADEPIRARRVGVAERLVKWARRRPAAVVAYGLSLLAAVLLLGVGGTTGMWLRAERAQKETTAALERAEEEKQRTDRARRLAEEAQEREARAREQLARASYLHRVNLAHRESQDGDFDRAEQLLEPCPADQRRWEWNYVKRLCRQAREAVVFTLEGHDGPVRSAAFSPDGKRLATASWDGTVKLWDMTRGVEKVTLRGHQGQVAGVAFSPDGKYLASASLDKTAKVWDLDTQDVVLTLKDHTNAVWGVAFSPDGTRLATASDDRTVRVWDAATGAPLQVLEGHKSGVWHVAFSPDGKLLASAADDGTARLWDAETGNLRHLLVGDGGRVTSVAFSPDGQRLAGTSWNRGVSVWDVATGRERHRLLGHTGMVWGVAFSPDGTRLATASADKTVRVWDAAGGRPLHAYRGHAEQVTGVAFSPDGTRLASSSGRVDSQKRRHYGVVKVWDATRSQEPLVLRGHTHAVSGVAVSPDGTRLASASDDKTVRVWDAATGQEAPFSPLPGHKDVVFAVAFSPDGKHLASAAWDGKVKVWDAATGRERLTFAGHTDQVMCVGFSPDGRRVVSGSMDNTVRVWDPADGNEVFPPLKGHDGGVSGVCFSPDGKSLASASFNGTVRVWDAATGREVLTLKGPGAPVGGVCFSPDGTRLATASWDAVVRVWDAATGRELLALQGHTRPASGVCFSPDGRRLASTADDQTVKVWDADTGEETITLRGHTSVVYGVGFSPDGKRLASASWDGTVRVWDTTP